MQREALVRLLTYDLIVIGLRAPVGALAGRGLSWVDLLKLLLQFALFLTRVVMLSRWHSVVILAREAVRRA